MDPALISAIVALLGTLGTGAGFLISRADKRREKRELAVETLLKEQYAKLEAQLERERQQAAERDSKNHAEIKHLKAYNSRIKSAAGKWREQLIANDIQPDPADWPEDNDE